MTKQLHTANRSSCIMEVDTVIAALGFMIAVLAAVIGSLLLVVVLYISHGRRKYSHLPSPHFDRFLESLLLSRVIGCVSLLARCHIAKPHKKEIEMLNILMML